MWTLPPSSIGSRRLSPPDLPPTDDPRALSHSSGPGIVTSGGPGSSFPGVCTRVTMECMEPGAGSLLIAAPTMGDPNFARSIVLLLDASESGALGVVLNRPTEL